MHSPCSSRVYFREYEHHYIKFAAKCNTCAEARHATAMSSGGCYVQAERLPGAHGRLLHGSSSHTHSHCAEARPEDYTTSFFALLCLHFLFYQSVMYSRLMFLFNLCFSVIDNPLNLQMSSFGSFHPGHYFLEDVFFFFIYLFYVFVF